MFRIPARHAHPAHLNEAVCRWARSARQWPTARAGRTQVVFDRNLMAHETVNCHPMRNTATTNIAREDLLRFIRESGHEPRILELEAPAPAEPPA